MSLGRGTLLLGLLGGVAALVALRLWQGLDYWNYSEGVYALSSRLWRDGADLYGTMVAAQPPGLFAAGAALLTFGDTLESLRLAVGTVMLAGGVLAAVAAHRLSDGSRVATALAPALVLLTPWAVHEHGMLTPETLVTPLLLGGALLASHPRTAAAGGALAALAVSLKLPFLLPLAGIVLLAADRRRAALGAGATLVAGTAVSLALFGDDLIRDVWTAQLDTGRRGPDILVGQFGQAAWSLAALAVPALFTLWRLRETALGRVWIGLSAGLALTVLSMVKTGTGLNILVPVEAALVAPALVAATRLRWAAVALAFLLVQTATLMASPTRTATPFIYPTSERGAWRRQSTEAEVRAIVAAAQPCPPGVAFSGPPLLAFVAERPPAGGQPDEFLTTRSEALLEERAAIEADIARCP